MNDDMMYEHEISLLDIFVQVFRKWQKVVFFSGIGAVLLAGYVLLTTMNPKPELVMNETQITEAEARLEEIEALLTVNEAAVEDKELIIENLEDSIEVNEMTIVNKESEIQRLKSNIEELDALEEIFQKTVDAILEANIVDEDFASDVMNLTVKIADVQHAVYDNESQIDVINKEIKDLEKANEVTVPKEIKKVEKQIEKLDKEAENLKEEADELEEKLEETFTPEFSLVKVVVFAALGVVLGLMIVCGYVVIVMLFDNKIHNTQVLESNFGLHVLGNVSEDSTVEKKNFIDQWIDKLQGINQNVNSVEELDVITAKIRALSKTRKVMAVGTIDAEKIQHLVKKLNRVGCDNGFELIAAGNPMYSADTLDKLKDYEVVLVEEIDETSAKELIKLVRFLRKGETVILGIIAE